MHTLPTAMIQLLAPFSLLFSERVWRHAQVLLAGTILTPGKRTVRSSAGSQRLGGLRLKTQREKSRAQDAQEHSEITSATYHGYDTIARTQSSPLLFLEKPSRAPALFGNPADSR